MRQTIKYARVRAVDVNRQGTLPVVVNGFLVFTRGVYVKGMRVIFHG